MFEDASMPRRSMQFVPSVFPIDPAKPMNRSGQAFWPWQDPPYLASTYRSRIPARWAAIALTSLEAATKLLRSIPLRDPPPRGGHQALPLFQTARRSLRDALVP